MTSSRRHFLVSAAAAVVSGCVRLPGGAGSVSDAETAAADSGFGWGDELALSAAELHIPKLSPITNTSAVARALEYDAGLGEVPRLQSAIRRLISVGRGSGTGRYGATMAECDLAVAVVMNPERVTTQPAADYA